MDKTYLIHNIEVADNPEDGHMTTDITISNLELTEQDLTATIGLGMFVNGMQASSNKYEDVSLTGAGGEAPIAQVKFNVTSEGTPVSNIANIMTLSECNLAALNITLLTLEQIANVIDLKISYIILNNTQIHQISATDESESMYVWNDSRNAEVISGDAVINEDGSITISGDCEITIEAVLD